LSKIKILKILNKVKEKKETQPELIIGSIENEKKHEFLFRKVTKAKAFNFEAVT
jgi:hypothetical protein